VKDELTTRSVHFSFAIFSWKNVQYLLIYPLIYRIIDKYVINRYHLSVQEKILSEVFSTEICLQNESPYRSRKGKQNIVHTILEDFSTSSLLQAMEENIQEAWIRLGRGLGAVVHDEPEVLWFLSGLPFHLANGIVRTHFPDGAVEEKLKQFTAHQVPLAWLIGPSTQPADLGSCLEQHGWMLEEAPGMAVDLRFLDKHLSFPSHLTITRVSDEEKLKTWLRIMTIGSIPEEGLTLLLDVATKQGLKEDPAVHYYLGVLDGQPVATSLLYLGGGVAGIYNVATLPEVRRQGIGSALTVAPLLEARAQGYRIGTLQSSTMGVNLYTRLGFREYCTFRAYFWQEP
jgi:ribosomal protein S18 acetylase RimI-like enzyme